MSGKKCFDLQDLRKPLYKAHSPWVEEVIGVVASLVPQRRKRILNCYSFYNEYKYDYRIFPLIEVNNTQGIFSHRNGKQVFIPFEEIPVETLKTVV